MHSNLPARSSLLVLLLAPLAAQRPDATFEWQKRTTTITYGAVPVGKHHLGELTVGQSWRLGNNEASTWQVGMPLLVGDAWLAPGQYRVTFVRDGEGKGSLVADGSAHALGAGADVRLSGDIEQTGKESKKLQLEWQKDGKADAGNQGAQLVVQFGPTQWRGTALALGHKEHKLGGGRLLAFQVPADRVERGAVPVATLSLGKDDKQAFNLVLSGATARLVPWMQAPTDSFGFGDVKPPAGEQTTEGKVTELAAPAAAAPVWTVREAKLQKDELRVVADYGSKAVEITVPVPKAPK
ncbi:MAG: hypothetical protein JNL08_05145 [Planctomycetes bacterium]|nr:hypothetical protein [Planctomycetota bacterium]